MAADQRFRPVHRLRRKKEVDRVFREGERLEGRYFRFILLRKEEEIPRILIVVGRKVGKAVVRNRVKRAVREGFRKNKELFSGLDVVVIAKPPVGGIKKPGEIEDIFLREFKEVRDASGNTPDQRGLRAEEEATGGAGTQALSGDPGPPQGGQGARR
ncbi:ribonuclease P protein component [Candidatus Acetothermia bacterium]|nr:MAG: ribonuclease P protein component [Candidatus Acetothermia bacterium]RLE34470.1 MAG: ribonuclease P protein component [Candidatus Acetothermia bacterium]